MSLNKFKGVKPSLHKFSYSNLGIDGAEVLKKNSKAIIIFNLIDLHWCEGSVVVRAVVQENRNGEDLSGSHIPIPQGGCDEIDLHMIIKPLLNVTTFWY